jgi:hypothetical protein
MTTYDSDLRALGEQVRKLEIQNRRWKIGTVILALVFASSLTMAMKPRHSPKQSVLRADIVKTQSLDLTNPGGKVLARFRVNPVTDQASMELYNPEGQVIWKAPGPLFVQ